MKPIVICQGWFGRQIRDAFARLDKRPRHQRGLSILVDTFAVNTGADRQVVRQTCRRSCRQDSRPRPVTGHRRRQAARQCRVLRDEVVRC